MSSAPNGKVGEGLKVCSAPPPLFASAPRSGERGENFEVGDEHILDWSNARLGTCSLEHSGSVVLGHLEGL